MKIVILTGSPRKKEIPIIWQSNLLKEQIMPGMKCSSLIV